MNESLESKIFLPDGKPASLTRRWSAFLIVLAISFIPIVRSHDKDVFAILGSGMIIMVACIAYRDRESISIEVSLLYKTLVYTYLNSLGEERRIVVDLANAGGHYKYDFNRAATGAWKLVLYNSNIFKNRVSIKARKKKGYTEQQLDEIVALVHRCKNKTTV